VRFSVDNDDDDDDDDSDDDEESDDVARRRGHGSKSTTAAARSIYCRLPLAARARSPARQGPRLKHVNLALFDYYINIALTQIRPWAAFFTSSSLPVPMDVAPSVVVDDKAAASTCATASGGVESGWKTEKAAEEVEDEASTTEEVPDFARAASSSLFNCTSSAMISVVSSGSLPEARISSRNVVKSKS